MSSFTQRMMRAARLDAALYEEVEADASATWQATGVVVLSSLAAGIAALAHGGGVGGVVRDAVFALVAWYLWALLTYWIGTRLLPEPQTGADAGELLRTTGFSSAAGMRISHSISSSAAEFATFLAPGKFKIEPVFFRCAATSRTFNPFAL